MSPAKTRPPTTTDAGIPVASQEHSLTVGPDGPILLQDFYLIEQMANFNRERIPERQPHAKGGGAFGRFVVTDDVSRFTKAAVFQLDAETEVVVRFSTVAGERGSPDTWRDPRGFAVRFYSSEGNLDIVGNNTPVFFIRDPSYRYFSGSSRQTYPRTRVGEWGTKAQNKRIGFLTDGTNGIGVRMITEQTGRWDQAAPEDPVATTLSDVVRGVT
jgi:catalase